jgi:hypothetical protein
MAQPDAESESCEGSLASIAMAASASRSFDGSTPIDSALSAASGS